MLSLTLPSLYLARALARSTPRALARPDNGSGTRPDDGSGTRPDDGSGTRPVNGAGTGAGTRPVNRAGDGTGTRARTGLATDRGEHGQATAEYALVLLGAAAIALLVVAWATRTDVVGTLLDTVFRQLRGQVG